MKKTYIYNGREVVASSKQEAIHQIVGGTKSNICVYVKDDYDDILSEYAFDLIYGLNKKTAYFDAERQKIACKDMKTANLIKQRLIKKLDGDEKSQKNVTIGKFKTNIFLCGDELRKWVKKNYKNLLTMSEYSSIELIPELPSEASEDFDNKDLYAYGTLVSVSTDDFFGTDDVTSMEGLLVKGKLGYSDYFAYDPINEDFSFDEIKKLIDSNLIKLKEVIEKYKKKQLRIINNECTPILTKISSFVR